ncbi:MAG: c-type cytochrome [Candidatus Limnocylindria bacterium]
MSGRSARRLSRSLFAALALMLTGSLGCWEQWSESWFPQMKWQKAVQAFERLDFEGSDAALLPPEGAVSVDSLEAPVENIEDPALDQLANPRSMSLASLENGRKWYLTYCVTCHGKDGMGDGPVSITGPLNGPFAGVLPLAVTAARSDGHIYTTIRYGRRRMPSYGRIASADRWDLVNYLRYLTKQKGIGQ